MNWRLMLHDFGVRHHAFMPPDPAVEKLSGAIRRGAELGLNETYGYTGCAIGTAYRARVGKRLTRISDSDLWHIAGGGHAHMLMRSKVSRAFNVPYEIVAEADRLHQTLYGQGEPSARLKVADWLESKGY